MQHCCFNFWFQLLKNHPFFQMGWENGFPDFQKKIDTTGSGEILKNRTLTEFHLHETAAPTGHTYTVLKKSAPNLQVCDKFWVRATLNVQYNFPFR